MSRYTFCMKAIVWLGVLAAAAGFAYWTWRLRRRWAERKRASEERFASFLAQATVPTKKETLPPSIKETPPPPIDAAAMAKQKLLLDAAAKAGEAGEPVLAIQLYARLLARYPHTLFAAQARAAVEAQKKNLAKG
jgi:hypothetical protein